MKNTDLTTANYDALKTYVLELRDRVMNKEYIKPIAESLANRNDLTLFQKCSIMDLIAEQSEISFARHPALAAPKGMPLLVKGIMSYRVGTDEANSGKLKNGIPAWCEEQKAIFKATPQQITVTDPDRHPADSVPAVPDEQRAINTDKLKALFKTAFIEGDDYKRDTLTGKKQTRFDVFCQRLEMILTDKDQKPTNKEIGGIAYMIYCSTYTVAEYQKPRKGKKGKFSEMINTFFDIVGMEVPSDTHPNKYKPSNDLIDYFGDILQYQ